MNQSHPRIKFGLYGGKEQWYVTEVDGTLARLGAKFPDDPDKVVAEADKRMKKLMREFDKRHPKKS